MMFDWTKKGKLFDPSGRLSWMQAYSQVPTVLDRGEFWRVYFACRPNPDGEGRYVSHTAYVDLAKGQPSREIGIGDEQVIALGAKGTFDEFGIHPTSIISWNSRHYLFYTGWARHVSVPYATWIGLAVSSDEGDSFEKVSEGPVIGPNRHDPFLANGAYVYEDSGSLVMIYASAASWIEVGQKLEPVYTLKRAVSGNGLDWQIDPRESILPPAGETECISRPSVLKLGDVFHMWYAHRSAIGYRDGQNSYRIGYARSMDGIEWERLDDAAGISLSEEGWDSEMMAYPQVVRDGSRLLMFYNGNFFGREGFGLATADF